MKKIFSILILVFVISSTGFSREYLADSVNEAVNLAVDHYIQDRIMGSN